MKQNKIFILTISLVIFFLVGCSTQHTNVIVSSEPAIATYECLAPQGSKTGQWYSPLRMNVDDRVPRQCETCIAPENFTHHACRVDRFIRSSLCSGLVCSDTQGEFLMQHGQSKRFALQHDLRFQDDSKYPRASGESCRFILWALDPVVGVEDIYLRKQKNYWQQSFEASQQLVSPRFPMSSLALGIQPATQRGQHQLHIHIGTLGSGYRKAIDSLDLDSQATQMIDLNGYKFYVRYIPDLEDEKPFSGRNPFDVVSEMIPGGERSMPLYGVLVAIAKNQKGIFVLASQNWERSEINFKQAQVCALNNTQQ